MDESKEPMPDNNAAVVRALTAYGRADIAQLSWMLTAGADLVRVKSRNYLGSDVLERRPLDSNKTAILDTLSANRVVVGYHLTFAAIPAMYWLAKVAAPAAPAPRGIMNLVAPAPRGIMSLMPLAARLPSAEPEDPGASARSQPD